MKMEIEVKEVIFLELVELARKTGRKPEVLAGELFQAGYMNWISWVTSQGLYSIQ